MAIYPEVMQDLVEACRQYRDMEIGEEALQGRLDRALGIVVAYDERELRAFLHNAEADIELLRFTVDTDKLRAQVLPLVEELERRARKARKAGGGMTT